jgi:hypothetical protein
MMVAPGIAASVAARFATTPGAKPSGRLGTLHPAAAAGIAGAPAGGLAAAAAPRFAPPAAPPAAAAGAGSPPEEPPRDTNPARLLPTKPAAAIPV